MTKKSLGLALGAGSARGLAHIGVLQVLEQEGIQVNNIAGSSIGAVVGGVYAIGTDLSMLSKLIPTLDASEYFDVVNPKSGGLIRGQKFQDLVRLFTKNATFSQTKIPFCVVAVDLENAKLDELNDPDLLVDEAIRASMAIPAVFQPYHIMGTTYVDGSVLSRVPGSTARKMGSDVVIGVDVGYRGTKNEIEGKGAIDNLLVVLDIMGWEVSKEKENEVDLMLTPDVRDIDPNSFENSEAAMEAGRAAARDALPEIQRLLQE